MIYDIRDCMYIYIFPMPPQVICRIRGPPSCSCLGCKFLLSLGRKWGVLTLSRWCVSCDRGGCSFRRGLKSKFYQFTQTMVTAGIFPFKENSRHYTNWPIGLQYSEDSGLKTWPEYYIAHLNVSVVLFSPSNKRPENNSRWIQDGIYNTLSSSLHIARYINGCSSYSPRKEKVFN
jgi:hypothetical protein